MPSAFLPKALTIANIVGLLTQTLNSCRLPGNRSSDILAMLLRYYSSGNCEGFSPCFPFTILCISIQLTPYSITVYRAKQALEP